MYEYPLGKCRDVPWECKTAVELKASVELRVRTLCYLFFLFFFFSFVGVGGWTGGHIYEYSELANFANGENDEYSFLISARAN